MAPVARRLPDHHVLERANKPASTTTTVSTIAMQSGSTRLVIAILQAGTQIDLKVLEMEPGIAFLGHNFEEAAKLQSAHTEVLNQMQSKQSPVEELLRQADDLIAHQKPKAEVYAAMAESLGVAWKDLNGQLDRRKTLLDQNYLFQGHLQDYKDKTERLDDLLRRAKTSQKHPCAIMPDLLRAKKKLLEATVFALQEGDNLLASLHLLWQQATLDSRPDFIRISVSLAIEQVEHWMESIYDRRLVVTRKLQEVQRWLNKASKESDLLDKLEQLQRSIEEKKSQLEPHTCDLGGIDCLLGHSTSAAEAMLKEVLMLSSEAQALSIKCLDCVNMSQEVSQDQMGSSLKAYEVMEQMAHYQRLLETRSDILSQASSFHQAAQAAMLRLDQLEMQVESINTSSRGKIPRILCLLDEIVQDIRSQGGAIVNRVRGPGAAGVKDTVRQLETKGSNIRASCGLKQSQANRNSETSRNFKTKLDQISRWLSTVEEDHIACRNSLGDTHEEATAFASASKDLLNKLQMKIFELEGMRGAFKIISDQCSTEETRDREDTIGAILVKIVALTDTLDARIAVATRYVKFLKLYGELDREMRSLEDQLLISKADERRQSQSHEESRLMIQQVFLQVCNVGKNCCIDLQEKAEARLLKDTALAHIQAIMDKINQKQAALIDIWNTLDNQAREGQLVASEEWNKMVRDAMDLLATARSSEDNMCPIIKGTRDPVDIVSSLEDAFVYLSRQKQLPGKLLNCLHTVQEMMGKLTSVQQKRDAKQLIADLQTEAQTFQAKINSYEILLQLLITYMKHVAEVKMTVRQMLKQYSIGKSPKDMYEAEMMAQEHEAGKRSTLEKVNFALHESLLVQGKVEAHQKAFPINGSSLLGSGTNTLQSLVAAIQADFDTGWKERKQVLTKHAKFCIFAASVQQLTRDIEDMTKTIEIKTTLEATQSSLSFATAVLNKIKDQNMSEIITRLRDCRTSGEVLAKDIPEHKSTVELGLQQLKEKFKGLETLLGNREVASEYFHLLHATEGFLREANKRILDWSRKAAEAKTVRDNELLKQQIEAFIKQHKTLTTTNTIRLITLGQQIFGPNTTHERTKAAQQELEATFDALTCVLIDVSNHVAERKNSELEAAKRSRLQVESEANIRAAKAEAEAAKQAAHEAEEQRRVAVYEQRTVCSHRQQTITEHGVREDNPPPRPPPPAPVSPLFKEYLKDIVLEEGKKCTMEARVSGQPTPMITWFKDGVSVHDNSDYKPFFRDDTGLCQLVIEETFVADSANWSVRASNIGGYAESHAKLTVREPKPHVEAFPPTFTIPLKETSAPEGGSSFLKCQVSGHPVPRLSWYKNGVCIDKNKNVAVQECNGQGILTISNVRLDDNTEFMCKATNILGSVSSSARITVSPLKPMEVPVFYDPLINVEATTGHPVRLECQVVGTPTPEITWSHNNRPIRRNVGVNFDYNVATGVATFSLNEAFLKASGKYTCRAKNAAGEATSTSVVTVKGIPPTEMSDSDAINESDIKSASKPAFYVPLKNQECHENEEVALESVVVSTPAPEVMWYKNNVPIKESAGFQFRQYGDSYKLILTNAKQGDSSGEYKVRAFNVAGECQSTCTLMVLPPRQQNKTSHQTESYSHTTISTEEKRRVVTALETPPRFLSSIQGAQINEEDSISLTARTSLKILKAKQCDAGDYSCMLDNGSGLTQCCAQVLIQKQSQRPMFLKRLCGISADVGDKIVAEVEVGGYPSPSVQWFKDGQPLTASQSVKLVNEGATWALIILSAREATSTGTYHVVATNEAGWAECTADVEVRPPPPRPPLPKRTTSPHQRTLIDDDKCRTTIQIRPESATLRTLSAHSMRKKELPELEPFPFKPNDHPTEVRRTPGRVPRPSKFIKGEMYHSDYESDWDGPPIVPTKWRSYHSDTEDYWPQYRSVKPKLRMTASMRNAERKPSPPCPHKWESHEEIERLEREMRQDHPNWQEFLKSLKRTHLQETLQSMNSSATNNTMVSAKNKDDSCSSTIPLPVRELSSTKKESPKPSRAAIHTNALTPSSSVANFAAGVETSSVISDEFSYSSQSTVHVKTVHVTVKEKVKMLEQMVQQQEDLSWSESEAAGNDLKHRSTPTIRPEEIPGAVRVLPPAASPGNSRPESRKGSRSASADIFRCGNRSLFVSSPLTLPRSTQSSPMTLPRATTATKYPWQRSSSLTCQEDKRSSPAVAKWSASLCRTGDIGVKGYRPVKVSLPDKIHSLSDSEAGGAAVVPPSQFEVPLPTHGKPRPIIDFEKTVRDIKRENTDNLRNQPQITKTVVTNQTSTLMEEVHLLHHHQSSDRGYSGSSSMERHSSSQHVYTGSDVSPPALELSATRITKRVVPVPKRSPKGGSTPSCEQSRGSPKSNRSTKTGKLSRPDGYEADTDDTLSRRRKSVKDLAKSFQALEDACPSPLPLRPKVVSDYSDYESDVEGRARSRSRGAAIPTIEPAFTASGAYVPPKWVSSSGSSEPHQQSYTIHQSHSEMMTSQHQQVVQFKPSKFVASTASVPDPEWTFKPDGGGKVMPKWTPPSGNHQEQTTSSYRKIQPMQSI